MNFSNIELKERVLFMEEEMVYDYSIFNLVVEEFGMLNNQIYTRRLIVSKKFESFEYEMKTFNEGVTCYGNEEFSEDEVFSNNELGWYMFQPELSLSGLGRIPISVDEEIDMLVSNIINRLKNAREMELESKDNIPFLSSLKELVAFMLDNHPKDEWRLTLWEFHSMLSDQENENVAQMIQSTPGFMEKLNKLEEFINQTA